MQEILFTQITLLGSLSFREFVVFVAFSLFQVNTSIPVKGNSVVQERKTNRTNSSKQSPRNCA